MELVNNCLSNLLPVFKLYIFVYWAIPEKKQTSGVEDIEFPGKKEHVETPGVN